MRERNKNKKKWQAINEFLDTAPGPEWQSSYGMLWQGVGGHVSDKRNSRRYINVYVSSVMIMLGRKIQAAEERTFKSSK